MGVLILSEGTPGSGKSRAIKYLDPETTVILRPNSKDLPFPGARKLYSGEKNNLFTVRNLPELGEYIRKINSGKKIKTVIVEDFTHLLGQRVLQDMDIKGYDKWTNLAVDAFESVIGIENDLREDLYIIVIAHTTTVINSDGQSRTYMLTPGRLLDNLIKIPSYFTYILHTNVREVDGKIQYKFLTNKDGSGKETKTPEEMFERLIDNDYAMVISTIEAYQNG